MHYRLHRGGGSTLVVATMVQKRVIPIRTAGAGREAELLAQGWTRQTTIGEPRLSEVVETYRSLGYDVEVIEHRSVGDACGVCFEAGAAQGAVYGDIYLRKKSDTPPSEDPLF